MRLFIGILFFCLVSLTKAQVGPPSLRCIACGPTGDLTLTWIIPLDPGGQFFSYEIYRSAVFAGPYVFLASVNTYTANTYNDAGAAGNLQAKYYFIKTRWGAAGTNTSVASDTVRSIYLNLGGAGTGTATLVYNNLHTPKLPTTATNFTINKQFPIPAWSVVQTTSLTNYSEVISRCNVFYSYQIQQADASGCLSTSNISGANFKDQTPPDAGPTQGLLDSVSVNAAGQSVLGWTASSYPDCYAYVIYQFGTTWAAIDTVYGINNTIYTTTSTIASTAATNYAIASLDSCGNIGLISTNPQSTMLLKSKYDVCARTTNLTWNAYQNLPLSVSHYQIYCSTNAGPYLYLGTSTVTAYQHTNLTPGKTYCYIVRVFNIFGAITSSSNRSCLVATAPPSSSFVYLKSASVDPDQSITVTLYCDTLVPCQGFNIYKSEDGASFTPLGFVPYNGRSTLYYNDQSVSTSQKSYFYKAEVLDSCGNSRFMSNIGKTILLHVKNDNDKIFNNNLYWNDYSSWTAGVAGYYVFRIVNDAVNPVPIDFVPYGISTYTDNVEDIVKESGKVGYYVSAVEGFGNPYGFQAMSSSNIGEAYVEAKVFVPNSFTPKGENRIWLPVAQFVEKTDYHVTVFNRWGAKVFETTSDTQGWDGSGMDDNTYVYLIQYKNSRGEFIELKGTVTMVR